MAEPLSLFICVIAGVRKQQRLREREKIAIMPRAKHMEAMLLTGQAFEWGWFQISCSEEQKAQTSSQSQTNICSCEMVIIRKSLQEDTEEEWWDASTHDQTDLKSQFTQRTKKHLYWVPILADRFGFIWDCKSDVIYVCYLQHTLKIYHSWLLFTNGTRTTVPEGEVQCMATPTTTTQTFLTHTTELEGHIGGLTTTSNFEMHGHLPGYWIWGVVCENWQLSHGCPLTIVTLVQTMILP